MLLFSFYVGDSVTWRLGNEPSGYIPHIVESQKIVQHRYIGIVVIINDKKTRYTASIIFRDEVLTTTTNTA